MPLSADKELEYKPGTLSEPKSYLMAASTTIYKGALVMLNSAGLAVPAGNVASNKGVVGVCERGVESAGSGSYYVAVREGVFLLDGASLEQADVGGLVYANDDETVDETQAANQAIAGELQELVGASSGWVRIDRAITRG